jgi:hypothetical protein
VHVKLPYHRMPAGGERGQAIAAMMLVLALVLILVCLVISSQVVLAARVSAQRAADAGALAGCLDLPDATQAQAHGIEYAASSGSLNAGSNHNLESGNGNQTATATVSNSGAIGANGPLVNDMITVDVTRHQSLFGQISLGFGDRTIPGHAVCRRDEGNMPVLLALNSGANTFFVQGQFNLNLGDEGGITVNSTDPAGLSVNGGATLEGRYIATGSGQGTLCGSCSVTPAISVGTQPDPYAGVAEPAVDPEATQAPGCAPKTGGTSSKPAQCLVSAGTVQPGVYWGGLKLGDGTAKTIAMAPGVYVMAGGGSGGNNSGFYVYPNTTLTGSGVTILNLPDPGAQQQANRDCGPVFIGQSANLQLSPGEVGGKYMLIFQGRETGSPSCQTAATIQAGATIGLPPAGDAPCGGSGCGGLYFPTAQVNIGPEGGGQAPPQDNFNTIFVAGGFKITGQLTFNNPQIRSGTVNHGDIALSE